MRERIFVGLSGGVDSSVAAKRLKDAGHDVVGVFIKTWQPDFIPCTWEAERLDAMRVAAQLNIPFLTCDAEAAYRDEVAAYMIQEYSAGRTPNPDVMCNKFVKFGAFLAFAKQHGATKIATGHYARIEEKDGVPTLMRGIDTTKDQSYFLWTLTEEQRAFTLFPVGDTKKADIRREAEVAGLPTAHKDDSQGICFLGEIDMKDFLMHHIPVAPGSVLAEKGEVIGTHDGALLYTIGQRHGFTISHKGTQAQPHYVVAKDLANNTITVSPTMLRMHGTTLFLSALQWNSPSDSVVCEAQCRYRQKPFAVRVTRTGVDTATVSVVEEGIETPSLGQACVLYAGDYCLGGGFLSAVE